MKKNKFVKVNVNGCWSAPFSEENNTANLVIYDEGETILILKENFETFEENFSETYDNYICLDFYGHPQWDGIVKFDLD